MAIVRPFRALRYDEGAAGPLDSLVAPPYDVISPSERDDYLARSPHNVVHLTLPDSEDTAARLWREWQKRGVLVREETPGVWELEQDFVGPDGVSRRRRGIVASLAVEPYGRGSVLPHERTRGETKEERLRLLRVVHAQLEPILLLYEGPPPVSASSPPVLEVDAARLRRAGPVDVEQVFSTRQLLIADGHHRYETALAYHEEQRTDESASMLAVLVSSSDPGVTIFPTHRVAGRLGEVDGAEDEEP